MDRHETVDPRDADAHYAIALAIAAPIVITLSTLPQAVRAHQRLSR